MKFIKTVATKCVEKFPDSNLPYILYYKNGKLMRTLSKITINIYPKITPHSLEHLFNQTKIDGFDKVQKESKFDFINEKLGKKKKRRESFDSDEDEREDKQFISNKIYLKYN